MTLEARALVIWKFDLSVDDVSDVKMPNGARILGLGLQDGLMRLWALVDPEATPVTRRFYVLGTGNPVPERVAYLSPSRYVGSVQQPFGDTGVTFVWHVFDGGQVE